MRKVMQFPSVNRIYINNSSLILGILLFSMSHQLLMADTLELPGYQREDGAITVKHRGDNIDPYFANKALLVSQKLGLDMKHVAKAWINWVINYQSNTGQFYRYCIRKEKYETCDKADADDAMLAVWIELLIEVSAPGRIPKEWIASWQKAKDYLFTMLLDKKRGIYIVSRSQRVGLLMDNVEVYQALESLEKYYSRIGDQGRAAYSDNQALKLKKNILSVFWQQKLQRYKVSTQAISDTSFYPVDVAQLFPLMAGIATPGASDAQWFQVWLRENQAKWFSAMQTDYPWGLLLLAALKKKNSDVVDAWARRAGRYRHGQHWNVLEEVVYQGVLPLVPHIQKKSE